MNANGKIRTERKLCDSVVNEKEGEIADKNGLVIFHGRMNGDKTDKCVVNSYYSYYIYWRIRTI